MTLIVESQLPKTPAPSALAAEFADKKNSIGTEATLHVVLETELGNGGWTAAARFDSLLQLFVGFCVAWVGGTSFILDEKRLQHPLYKTITVMVMFCGSFLIGDKFARGRYPVTAHVFRAFAIGLVVIAFYVAAGMHLYST